MTALLVIIIIGCGAGWLNRQNWVRAKDKIEQLPEEKRLKAWEDFEGYAPQKMYGGIFAGVALNRIWVWSREGLKSFPVDRYSTYSWYDGCNTEVLSELNEGVAGAIGRKVFTNISGWNKEIKAGDYVRIYLTTAEMGGTTGNLREIYGYNFWLFLPVGMEERCEK